MRLTATIKVRQTVLGVHERDQVPEEGVAFLLAPIPGTEMRLFIDGRDAGFLVAWPEFPLNDVYLSGNPQVFSRHDEVTLHCALELPTKEDA